MLARELMKVLGAPTMGFLLKLFAGLAALGFGILGVGAETRDAGGKLTRKGWIALIGIIVAGILALGTSISEFVAGQEKEQAERRHNERLMLSVQRNLYPLRSVRVS